MEENDAKPPVENWQENYNLLKKTGRIYFFIFLATIPGLFIISAKLHVIKIGFKETIRCEIKPLENSTWKWEEIRDISEPPGAQECFIYNYNYSKLVQMTFQDAKKFVEKEYPNGTKIACSRFIAASNNFSHHQNYAKDFVSYCGSLKSEIIYDILAITPYILSCLIVVPFADVFGRKRILFVGCQLAYIAVFLKFILLDFTREALGEGLLNLAHPPLKYATEAIIFETTGNTLRPLAFVLIFTGMHIPPLIVGTVPPVTTYWKCVHLMTCSIVLLLPLLTWYLPETPVWFASKKLNKLARFSADTINNPVKQNEALLHLRNKKGSLGDIKELLVEFKKINRCEFVLINAVSFGIGVLSFYPYSEYKLINNRFDNKWLKILNACSGFLAVVLSIPCVYFMNVVQIFLAIFFILSATLYGLTTKASSNIIFIILNKITTNILTILFEFFLHEKFPTSHRCLCTALCGISINLGLLFLLAVRDVNIFASVIVAIVGCFIGCICSLITENNLKRINPLFVSFANIKKESTMKICTKCLLKSEKE